MSGIFKCLRRVIFLSFFIIIPNYDIDTLHFNLGLMITTVFLEFLLQH